MLANRSMPASTVIPELAYPNVADASDWLCRAFGFTLRLRIADHRAQLNVGDGAIVVTERRPGDAAAAPAQPPVHSVMVRVDDADASFERARQAGATILRAPSDYPYGERQFTVEDPGGHVWTFSQSIADVAPEEWGGTAIRSPS
jgi:uncharacterized glyoxalase superfamily protein PhnB